MRVLLVSINMGNIGWRHADEPGVVMHEPPRKGSIARFMLRIGKDRALQDPSVADAYLGRPILMQ